MKTAIVTGTSYGLGESIASMLLKNNFKVYGVSRSEPKIKNENFVWIKADLLKEESYDLISSSVSEEKIDVLVNNAGTAFLTQSSKFTEEAYEKMFGLNFKAPIKLTTRLLKKYIVSLIVNISSVSDRFTDKDWALYSASKAALNIYFEGIADEYKSIKVVNLLPSYIETPLQHKISDNTNFNWSAAMSTNSVSESIWYIVENIGDIPNCPKVIVVNNELIEDIEDPEKLYYYNVDTKEFKKLK